MTQVLELHFETAIGKTTVLTIDAPKPTIKTAEIQQVMQTIIAKNVFEGQAGTLVAIKGARIIDRQVTDLELVMA